MRTGNRSGPAVGKISIALLVGVVVTAMVVLGGGGALGQQVAPSPPQAPTPAPPFTAIDLNPSGFDESHGMDISGGEQVGYGAGPATGGHTHALLWRGSAASVVDLHPSNSDFGAQSRSAGWDRADSAAVGVCGGQQVGYGGSVIPLLWRGSAASVVDLSPSKGVQLEGIGEAGIEYSQTLATSGDQQVGGGRETATSGNSHHALLWRGTPADVVELQAPSGIWESYAVGTSAEEQVGYGYWGRASEGVTHALLWHGSPAAAVDLHPRGFSSSEADSTSGGQQVGYGSGPATGGQDHALLWRDSAESVVDLHPAGFFYSRALGTNGEEQVGWGDQHALLWQGTAASVVDLHTFLPPGFTASVATDIDATGDIVGTAWGPASGNRYHAFLWERNVPKPPASGRQSTSRCQDQP